MVSRFRDVKRKARRDLHAHMEVAALYLVTPTATPVPCTVRVWTKWGQMGKLAGAGWAELQETAPKIIFVEPSFRPRAQALVSIEPGEAYRIDTTQPADDISITAEVTRLNPKNAADQVLLDSLPVPE